jgi:Ca2+-binding RTX toxin-like protein
VRGAFTANDKIDGGDGNDQVALNGDYAAGVAFNPATMTNVETLILRAGFSYNLTTDDATVAAGATLSVQSGGLGTTDSLTFDGSHETDGRFDIVGGAGNDAIVGGSGDDTIVGGQGDDTINGGNGHNRIGGEGGADRVFGGDDDDVLFGGAGNDHLSDGKGNDLLVGGVGDDVLDSGPGADTLTGGKGNDTFGIFEKHELDTITDFETGEHIDLPQNKLVKVIDDPITNAHLDRATFDDEVKALLTGLTAKHVIEIDVTSGDLAGHRFVAVGTSGENGYQAGFDYLIGVDGPGHIAVDTFI